MFTPAHKKLVQSEMGSTLAHSTPDCQTLTVKEGDVISENYVFIFVL